MKIPDWGPVHPSYLPSDPNDEKHQDQDYGQYGHGYRSPAPPEGYGYGQAPAPSGRWMRNAQGQFEPHRNVVPHRERREVPIPPGTTLVFPEGYDPDQGHGTLEQIPHRDEFDHPRRCDMGLDGRYDPYEPMEYYEPEHGHYDPRPIDGYDRTHPADGHDQTHPADGYDHTHPADGYDQTQPADGHDHVHTADCHPGHDRIDAPLELPDRDDSGDLEPELPPPVEQHEPATVTEPAEPEVGEPKSMLPQGQWVNVGIGALATLLIGVLTFLVYRYGGKLTCRKKEAKRKKNKKKKSKKKNKNTQPPTSVPETAPETPVFTSEVTETETPSPEAPQNWQPLMPADVDDKWEEAPSSRRKKKGKKKSKSRNSQRSPSASTRIAKVKIPSMRSYSPAYTNSLSSKPKPSGTISPSWKKPVANFRDSWDQDLPSLRTETTRVSNTPTPRTSFQRRGSAAYAARARQQRYMLPANRSDSRWSPKAQQPKLPSVGRRTANIPRNSPAPVAISSDRMRNSSNEYVAVQESPRRSPATLTFPTSAPSISPVAPTRKQSITETIRSLESSFPALGEEPTVKQTIRRGSLGPRHLMREKVVDDVPSAGENDQDSSGLNSPIIDATISDDDDMRSFPTLSRAGSPNPWGQRAKTSALISKIKINDRPTNIAAELAAGALHIEVDSGDEIIDATAPKQVEDSVSPVESEVREFNTEAMIQNPVLVSSLDLVPIKVDDDPVMLPTGTKIKITERLRDLLHIVEPIEGWILEQIDGKSTVTFPAEWFPGKHSVSQEIPDPRQPRKVGLSYIVNSQLPALPHITIRPEMSSAVKRIEPESIDLPEAVWTALNVVDCNESVAQRIHDDYIMHPSYPNSRMSMAQDHHGKYHSCKRLPVKRFPQLIKDGYIVFCHFYINGRTNNMFPKGWVSTQKAHNANLLLTFRPHVGVDGKLGVEVEYFIPREIWMTLDNTFRASLFDLANRTAENIGQVWEENLPLVSSRMCFSNEMLQARQMNTLEVFHESKPGVEIQLKNVLDIGRTEFFFDRKDLPATFRKYQKLHDVTYAEGAAANVERIGLVRYEGLFLTHEIKAIEDYCDKLQNQAEDGELLPNTSHDTVFMNKCRRTKHFFKARYLWTKEQLEQAGATRAGGLRTDVDPVPGSFQFIIQRLELAQIVPEGFINGVALNMYHDGTLGIGLHFDCNSRFDRPIISLRLFSPARLAFGGHNLGENAVCVVDLPQGAVLSMDPKSYGADGVKHNVRSCDMVTKSAALIFRHLWEDCLDEADQLQSETKNE